MDIITFASPTVDCVFKKLFGEIEASMTSTMTDNNKSLLKKLLMERFNNLNTHRE